MNFYRTKFLILILSIISWTLAKPSFAVEKSSGQSQSVAKKEGDNEAGGSSSNGASSNSSSSNQSSNSFSSNQGQLSMSSPAITVIDSSGPKFVLVTGVLKTKDDIQAENTKTESIPIKQPTAPIIVEPASGASKSLPSADDSGLASISSKIKSDESSQEQEDEAKKVMAKKYVLVPGVAADEGSSQSASSTIPVSSPSTNTIFNKTAVDKATDYDEEGGQKRR